MNANNIIINLNGTEQTINTALEALNAEKDVGAAHVLLTALEEAVKVWNQETVKAAVDAFVHEAEQDRTTFFRDFIQDPFVEVARVKQSKDDGTYSVVPAMKQVSFSDVEKAWGKLHDGTLAQSKRYVGMIARFTHNMHTNLCAALSEEGPKVKVQKFRGDAVEVAEYDFNGNSVGKLQGQLQAIVETILPEGMELKMVKADVRALLAAHQTEKMMEFTTAAEKKVINQIFGSMRVRMSGEAYVVKSKARCHKVPREEISERTPAQEEKTSKIPDRAEAAATLGKKSGK